MDFWTICGQLLKNNHYILVCIYIFKLDVEGFEQTKAFININGFIIYTFITSMLSNFLLALPKYTNKQHQQFPMTSFSSLSTQKKSLSMGYFFFQMLCDHLQVAFTSIVNNILKKKYNYHKPFFL